jgi:hypothetical protein
MDFSHEREAPPGGGAGPAGAPSSEAEKQFEKFMSMGANLTQSIRPFPVTTFSIAVPCFLIGVENRSAFAHS